MSPTAVQSDPSDVRAAKAQSTYSLLFKVIIKESSEDTVDSFSRKRGEELSGGCLNSL